MLMDIVLAPSSPIDGDDGVNIFWDEIFGRVGTYYAHAISLILDLPSPRNNRLPPPGFALRHQDRIIDKLRTLPNENIQSNALFITCHYLTCITAIYIARSFQALPAEQTRRFEKVAVSSLADLYANSLYSTHYQKTFSMKCMKQCVSQLSKLFEAFGIDQTEYKRGIFSSIRLSELPMLAARSETVVKRYGDKMIERLYEQQLSILMQSFGFVVTSARVAERRVDLTCISVDRFNGYVFLLDAKSSKRPYSLPVDDERALREYVESSRANLVTLPPLRFLMIVGHRGSPSLARRLNLLEGRLGIPVRFCPAHILASLREAIPGPVPFQVFAESVVMHDPILGDGFVEAVQRAFELLQHGHTTFVRSMMSLSDSSQLQSASWKTSE
jgi:hypothetical protein